MSQFSFTIRSAEDIANVPTQMGFCSDDFIPLPVEVVRHSEINDEETHLGMDYIDYLLMVKESHEEMDKEDYLKRFSTVRSMTSDIAQLDAQQDSVYTGTHIATQQPFDESFPDRIDCENFDWMILADGHGSEFCFLTGKRSPSMVYKQLFDALDMDKVACSNDPATYIREQIPDSKYKVNLGATFILVKIFADRVEFYSIGDSQCRMYKNGEFVYKNELHKPENPKEMERLKDVSYSLIKDFAPAIISATQLEMVLSSRIQFIANDVNLALSQSIGHHHVTGIFADRATVPIDSNDIIQIVIGSDGVFDVLNDLAIEEDSNILRTGNATEILKYSENRWKQPWIQMRRVQQGEYAVHDAKTGFNTYDDISVAVWSQHKECLFDLI